MQGFCSLVPLPGCSSVKFEQTHAQHKSNQVVLYSILKYILNALFSVGRAGLRIKKLHFLSTGEWTFPQLCNKITPDRNSNSLLIHLAKARFISAHSQAFPSILPSLCNLLSACTSNLPVQVASKFISKRSQHLSSTEAPRGQPRSSGRASTLPLRPLYLVVVTRDLVPAPAQLLGQSHVLLLQSLELLGLESRCQLERFTASTESIVTIGTGEARENCGERLHSLEKHIGITGMGDRGQSRGQARDTLSPARSLPLLQHPHGQQGWSWARRAGGVCSLECSHFAARGKTELFKSIKK